MLDENGGPNSDDLNQCRFIEGGARCAFARVTFSIFCSCHKTYFSKITNPQLLELAATYSSQLLYVTNDKGLAVVEDRALWGNWHNCLEELEARGYSTLEMFRCIAAVREQLKLNEEIDRLVALDPKWKKFEKVVAGIHKLKGAGAQITFNDKIKGRRSGRDRQIDVSIRFRHGYYEYLTIVECKESKSKVALEKIEALLTKMEDVGAQQAVLVASSGFQQGVIEAARAYNIELRTLSEEVSDWKRVLKVETIRIPYPTVIEFDHDPVTEDLSQSSAAWDDILFYRAGGNVPLNLTRVVRDVLLRVQEDNERLPCEVTIPFEPGWSVKFPQLKSAITVRSIMIRFEPYDLKTAHEIDLPPKPEKYIYSDVEGKQRHEIPVGTIPIGLDTVLEPGKYYTDSLGRPHRCLSVEGDTANWLLMKVYQGRDGRTFFYEFGQDVRYACYYLPIANPLEIEHLEELYQFLGTEIEEVDSGRMSGPNEGEGIDASGTA